MADLPVVLQKLLALKWCIVKIITGGKMFGRSPAIRHVDILVTVNIHGHRTVCDFYNTFSVCQLYVGSGC